MSDRRWPVDPFAGSAGLPAGVRRRVRDWRRSRDARSDVLLPDRATGARVAADRGNRGPGGDGRGPRAPGDLVRLARGGALTFLGSIASSILGLALVVVITRSLRPASQAGALFEAIALFMILSNAAELGADTGLVRMVASYLAVGRARDIGTTLAVAMWPVFVVASAVAVAVFVTADDLASVFIHGASREDAADYIRLFAPFLPLASATTVALSATRGFGTMTPYVAIQNVAIPLSRPILVALAVAGGLGATAVALSWALPVAVGFAVALWTMMRLWRGVQHRARALGMVLHHGRNVGSLAGEFWRFTAPRGLAGFFMAAVLWLNILLVGAMATTREAAIYAAVSRLVGVGTFALQAVGIALAPQIANLLARGERSRAEGLYQTGAWWLMALGWPMYISMAVFAPILLQVFRPEYVRGQHTLVILSLALLTLVGTGNNKIVLLMGGGSGWNLLITGVSLVLNVGLNLALVPGQGMEGAALAFAVSVVFDMAATTWVVWRRMGVEPFGSGYPLVAFGALLCYAGLGLAVRSVFGATYGSFLGFAVVATCLYGAWLWRFRRALRLPVLKAALMRRMEGRAALLDSAR